jgi:tripeptide aminopeptidase
MNENKNMIGSTVVERFLRYVKIDTQSSETSKTFPSTDKQKNFGKMLVKELKSIGLKDVKMDKWGYIFATLESNLPPGRKVPTLGFIAHLDTSPDVAGKNIKPVLHKNYNGKDIVLPKDKSQVIRVKENPTLKRLKKDTIITADGTTLLGADDKAGIAEIFDAVNYFVKNPQVKHGRIRIGLTPDEEIGNGTAHFDVKRFAADYAYTIDGGEAGEVENETFCADSAIVKFLGKNVHPGYAKDRMINSMKAGAHFITLLKRSQAPEGTEKKQGYIHPNTMKGNVEETEYMFLVRDFKKENLKKWESLLKKLAQKAVKKVPGSSFTIDIKESYRNMIYPISKDKRVVKYALDAVRKSGIKPLLKSVRGGTDGARLSFEGLLTPNLFDGGENFHSKLEFVPVSTMKKASETIINLIKIWRDRSK